MNLISRCDRDLVYFATLCENRNIACFVAVVVCDYDHVCSALQPSEKEKYL